MSDGDAGNDRIGSIAIVGGGTAGWMAAALLARALPGTRTAITVIESPDIGTVGVGEATIPPIIDVLKYLSIDEADFIHHTQATYKLGIKFRDWRETGSAYWHPFGTFGAPINRRPFFHCWHKARAEGIRTSFQRLQPVRGTGRCRQVPLSRQEARIAGGGTALRPALRCHAGGEVPAQLLRAPGRCAPRAHGRRRHAAGGWAAG
jgi:tryptophan 7-halogenase